MVRAGLNETTGLADGLEEIEAEEKHNNGKHSHDQVYVEQLSFDFNLWSNFRKCIRLQLLSSCWFYCVRPQGNKISSNLNQPGSRLRMDRRSKEKKQVEEISFMLENIFIVHPNPGSKYKIRVVINRHNKQHPFKKVNNRYTFQLEPQQEIPKNACFMVLLQKTTKNGVEGQYLEIGKGELELAEAMEQITANSDCTVHGVIYGTRSFNYDRIIGKYSYKICKNGATKQTLTDKNNKPNFIDHKKRQKPAQFAFKKSIMEHNHEINQKIKQLASSMDQIMGHSRQEHTEPLYTPDAGLPSIAEVPFEEYEYLYKYNSKIEEMLKEPSNCKEFRVLTIKNIRIDKQKPQDDTIDSLMKSRTDKLQQNILNEKKAEFMIIFYELLQDRKMRKRLLQIYLPLAWGKDNRMLVNSLFYLPNNTKKTLIEIVPVTSAYNKDRSLNGVIEPSHAKSRLIELLDSSQQERGIFICILDRCTEIDKQQIKGYQRQTDKFERFMKKYNCQFTSLVKKPTPKPQIKEFQEETKILDNSAKDTLYSQFHPKKKLSPSKKNRIRTEACGSIDIQGKASSISRSRNNFSVLSEKAGGRRQTRTSLNLESKSIRGYPSDSETVVPLQKDRFKKKGFQGTENSYRLYFESVQINMYGLGAIQSKVLLKFEMFQQSQTKKVNFTSQKDWYPLRIEFKNKKINEAVTISLLLNRQNTTKYLKIGTAHLQMSQFKESPSHKLKVFITNRNKITSYLVLDFRLFRQKHADEITQSFYYKEQYDRQRSLISEGDKQYDQEPFDKFQQTDIPERAPVFDISQEQLQLSVDSNKISNAKNTQVHYISDKMSDKAPSEVLEEEEYQNGKALKKRY